MSEILKPPRLCMLLLAIALVLSQFIMLGCCDSDINISSNNVGAGLSGSPLDDFNEIAAANSLSPTGTAGNIASVGTIDKHSVISYGNGAMGLANDMETGLTLDEDGSILKSRKIAMFSYGSELMEIGDFSSLTGYDVLGNEFGTQSENLVTLKNCVYPFAMVKEDLTKVSSDGLGIDDIGSNTILLLPDLYTADDLAMFSAAFGDSGVLDIKMFKYSNNLNAFFSDAKLAGFDINGIFSKVDIMGTILEVIDLVKKQQEQDQNNDDPSGPNRWDSNGGVLVNWAQYD